MKIKNEYIERKPENKELETPEVVKAKYKKETQGKKILLLLYAQSLTNEKKKDFL